MFETVGWAAPLLPAESARYFMGIGDPAGCARGDRARDRPSFDCVLPTRLGRTGAALTWDGRLKPERNAPLHAGSLNRCKKGCA